MFHFAAFEWADLLPFILVGFAAQAVDGAMGMAFGVISSTALVVVLGMPPAQASARIHLVECFTTGVSGISHILHGNVDWKLFLRLLVPGVIGGVAGAYFLTGIDGSLIKPFVLAYLIAIGLWLLWRGLRHVAVIRKPKFVEPFGLVGGFLDAVGGGGWGPIVTSNLLVQGVEPRKVVGTVNSVEFLLTISVSATFLTRLKVEDIAGPTIGLLIGGLIAAPFGAFMAKRISPWLMLTLVGAVLVLTSGYGLYRALG